MQVRWGRAVAATLCSAVITASAAAHETDQWTVPLGKEFADIGDYLTEVYYDGIERAVNRCNEKIREAQKAGRDPSNIAYFQSPKTMTGTVYREFAAAMYLIEGFDYVVHRDGNFKKRYPGRITGYWESIHNVFTGIYFPLDPRQFFRFFHACTMEAYGTYFGPDKLGHFTDMGHVYYTIYARAIADGATHAEALEEMLREGRSGLVFGEEGMLGYLSSGVYSNADLASNYAGFKFYLNVTQETRVKGVLRPPMVVRDGPYWRISPHVRRDSDFFTWFISDHWNEALNVGLWGKDLRDKVRDNVRERSDRILDFYRDENGSRRTKAYFDGLIEEFSTYYGEEYGYRGTYDELVCIGNTCYEAPPLRQSPPVPNAAGCTELHWGAMTGDRELVLAAHDAGAPVDELVQSTERSSAEWGSTALHMAAAGGHADVVTLLLDRGANVNRANDRGATPLHKAIGSPDVVEILLAHDAEVDARDERGRSPLHWLGRYPTLLSARMLIEHGAAVDARDHRDETPLHRASMAAEIEMMELLLAAGADPDARARFRTVPLHFAARQRDARVVELLADRGVDLDAADEFGLTPLHDAARRGYLEIADALLARGAHGQRHDCEGSTPLHVAVRYGHEAVAALLLERGVAVNVATRCGSQPLHEAVFAGRTPVINLLLQYGADTAAINDRGESPIDLASADDYSLAVLIMESASLSAQPPVASPSMGVR